MDVLDFEIRMLPDDLLRRHSGSEKLQNVGHANPHTANARTPSALPRVDGDPLHQLSHAPSLAGGAASGRTAQASAARDKHPTVVNRVVERRLLPELVTKYAEV